MGNEGRIFPYEGQKVGPHHSEEFLQRYQCSHVHCGLQFCQRGTRELTRTAARELARHGITANVICPGSANASYKKFEAMAPEMAAEILKRHPMGRMGDSKEDIAPLALFLASDESRYVTGSTIHVDAGSHINGVAWAMELPE